jgi:hypothetical protein
MSRLNRCVSIETQISACIFEWDRGDLKPLIEAKRNELHQKGSRVTSEVLYLSSLLSWSNILDAEQDTPLI